MGLPKMYLEITLQEGRKCTVIDYMGDIIIADTRDEHGEWISLSIYMEGGEFFECGEDSKVYNICPRKGIQPSDLDYVLLSHLDCDHANGVGLVKDAKHILVSKDELIGSQKKNRKNQIRYQSKWWKDCTLETFDWNDNEGPFGKAFDFIWSLCK